jgi:hypothetical protein
MSQSISNSSSFPASMPTTYPSATPKTPSVLRTPPTNEPSIQSPSGNSLRERVNSSPNYSNLITTQAFISLQLPTSTDSPQPTQSTSVQGSTSSFSSSNTPQTSTQATLHTNYSNPLTFALTASPTQLLPSPASLPTQSTSIQGPTSPFNSSPTLQASTHTATISHRPTPTNSDH